MEIELAKCECCGLKEDCTQDYINEVKDEFNGKWICGLCAESVRDEIMKNKKKKKPLEVDEAMKSHMTFCRKFKSNPAVQVADGMKQILRRRSGNLLSSSPSLISSSSSSTSKNYYMRSMSTSQVGDRNGLFPSLFTS